METHADHLHHAPGNKFWHYFYEFLMLFLAVFCGFLAENFREHRVERERAEQYILSFYEDLKSDTARLSLLINFDEQKVASLNNMFNCYDTVLKNWKATTCMWELVRKSQTNKLFQLTGRTLKQLSNAGGYRLLRIEDADSIINYETKYASLEDFQNTAFQEAQDNVRNTFSAIADFRANKQLKSTLIGTDSANIDTSVPMLISADKPLLNKYFNELLLYMRVTKSHCAQMERIRKNAIDLIAYFNNKYHIG
jgi:hypothetical protein